MEGVLVMKLKEIFEDVRALCGNGGFYQYHSSTNLSTGEKKTTITGPFSKRTAAEGPTWNARLPVGVELDVKYHSKPPEGAQSDPFKIVGP